MLIPLCGSAYFLVKALATYPRDVATAAAAARRTGANHETLVGQT